MKTCIITGGNSGIGKSAAFQIAAKGYRVVLVCRNIPAADQVCIEIKEKTGNANVYAMKADLSLVSDVKNFVNEYVAKHGSLDVLINNAADFDISRKKPLITSEGNEAQFATNYLAPFLLTKELLPLLERSDDGRIINISSKGLMVYPGLKFDFENTKAEKSYDAAKTYYQTKLALLMHSYLLRGLLEHTNVSIYTVCVTNVKVDMNRYQNMSKALRFVYSIKTKFSISPDQMAEVYTALATGEKQSGFYFDEKMKEVKANKAVYDKAAAQKLWDFSQKLV